MFKTEIQSFNASQKIILSHQSGISAEILPEYGGALNSLIIKTRNNTLENIIDGYTEANEPHSTGEFYKGVFLFPFPNRLKNGKWKNGHQELSFPINEPARNNALHGFLYNKKFEVMNHTSGVEFASLHLRFKPMLKPEYYPFDYQIDIEYILTETDGLTIKTRVQNRGNENLPFGLGWHPNFKTGSEINSLIMNVSHVKALEVDGQMIPNGNKISYRLFENPQTIGEANLDTGFEIQKSETFKIQLFDPEKKLKFYIWQKAGSDGYGYVQIYTPPHRNSIAIEPMTSRANALQDKDGGLQILAPGNAQTFIWGIGF